MINKKILWMLAAILIYGTSVFTACTSNDDNPAPPSQQGMEESLVGLWYEELEYTGVLEDTGEAFTSVVLAMQVNEDHTGCLYAGAFNGGDYDNPIVVYGGPEEAGFTWQLTSSGQLIMTGDLNSYYERDSICSQIFSVIEQTGRATVGDAWITLERGGKFPAMVEGPVTNDPGSTTWALKGQTLDKIIYINPTDGPQLKPLSFSVDSATYVRPDGKTPLGDHAPVSAKFRFLPR